MNGGRVREMDRRTGKDDICQEVDRGASSPISAINSERYKVIVGLL